MEKMELVDRKFKLWFYQVSYSEAIIRSPKVDIDKTYNTNIDIYLGGLIILKCHGCFAGCR
ncbi:MAG: hypothetical protein HDT30_06355 [Clostridiales bacterium]|nr:hypothetical protein [Clostridiales bacterium]